MVANRLWRTLSAFNHSAHRWVPIPSSIANAQRQATQRLPLTPPSRPPLRNADGISTPTLSLEVAPATRDSLLNDAKVRDAFLVTHAEDQVSFEGVPFATMTLLSSERFISVVDLQRNEEDGIKGGGKLILGHVSQITLPSKYKRDALSVDIIHPTTPDIVLRLINVHLDSLWDTLHYRTQQMEILAGVLRETGCSGGIIAGDFNAISPEDDALVHKNQLVDAWVALHETADANEASCTWGVGVKLRDGLAPGRLDKVAMLGIGPEKIEVLRPGSIEVPRPADEPFKIPWSDHCGLRCTFAI